MVAAIEIESLSKQFKRRKGAPVRAVDGLSLSVPAGQVFGFLGPNGAGKTTTIKMACGLVKPTSGSVRLNGYDVARQRGEAMRQIGAVLEGTRNVYWRMSPWDNLMYFGGLKGQWGKGLKARAEGLLRELNLWERRRDPVRGFSRGMQQKVAIACALVADPPIVLLDEPTLGLDVDAARTVRRWVETLAREQGKTILITTHQLDMAEKVCDRVAIMQKGRIVADRPVSELLTMYRTERYEIRVKGHLDGQAASFGGMEVSHDNGDAILTGAISEPSELHRALARLGALGLPVLSVTRAEPDLEEVFVQLTREGSGVGG
ncbi:MAG: ABC transporter ATP-binding protein [Chloroflexi bacterium]|nr:ABC transporter ATP-binding protein [Chloroflexota bacterium]